MNKKIIATAALLGMLAIVFGAFGAHALKKQLSLDQLSTFETGVKYQMYHALFLLFIGSFDGINDKIKNTIFNLIVVGLVLFSGSIYLLATRNITQIDFSAIGIATPVGGLFLILGWFLLIYTFLTTK